MKGEGEADKPQTFAGLTDFKLAPMVHDNLLSQGNGDAGGDLLPWTVVQDLHFQLAILRPSDDLDVWRDLGGVLPHRLDGILEKVGYGL